MTPTGITIGSIVFGTTAGYHITGPISRSMANPKRVVRQTLYGFSDRQLDLILNGLCEWTIPVRLSGTSAADLIDLIQTVNAELTKQSNTLVDSLGTEVGVSFEMFRSPMILPNRGELTESRKLLEHDLLIYTRSWGSRPEINLSQQDITGVGLVALGTMDGDLASPLDLLLSPTYSGMSRAYVAVTPVDAQLGDYMLAADDGTGWQRVAGSGSAYNDQVAYTVENYPGWSGLDFPPPPAGRYWVVLRARTDVAGYLGLSEDAWPTPYSKVYVDSDNYHLYLAGEFQGTGTTGLTILGQCDGADAVYLDQVLLFPVDEAACSFACDVPPGHNLHLVEGLQTMITTGGDALDVARYCIGDGIVAPLDDRSLLVAVGDQSGGHPKGVCHVDVGYNPLHWVWAHEEQQA